MHFYIMGFLFYRMSLFYFKFLFSDDIFSCLYWKVKNYSKSWSLKASNKDSSLIYRNLSSYFHMFILKGSNDKRFDDGNFGVEGAIGSRDSSGVE